MNANELKAEMIRHNETGDDLAKALGISRQSLSDKMRDASSRVFTQKEMATIIRRYSLDPDQVMNIFFAK